MLTKPPCNAENLIICLLLTPREKMQRQTLLLSLEANLHNRYNKIYETIFGHLIQYARPFSWYHWLSEQHRYDCLDLVYFQHLSKCV